jgi:SAM-dependent methyltransferase
MNRCLCAPCCVVCGVVRVQGDGREESRASDVVRVLPSGWRPTRMLDVGCAEGKITAAIGKALQLPSASVHGCDIRDVGDTTGFTFALQTDPCKLPYRDGEFDLICLFMALHHFVDVDALLKEVRHVSCAPPCTALRPRSLALLCSAPSTAGPGDQI